MKKTGKPALYLFETFLVVAEKLSFTQAAEVLATTKSAVSHSIKSLETQLGVDLFIRSTRKISLTTEGELLQQQCERLQAELDTARDLVNQFDQTPQGTLTISCSPALAQSHLLPLILIYKQRYSQVKINILLEERMPDLKADKVDIVFGVNWPAPLDVVAKKISTTRYILCASPQYLEQYGTPKYIQDLAGHELILHAGRDKNLKLVSLKKQSTIPELKTTITVNNIEFMKQCALNHLGLAQFHDYAIQSQIDNGNLIEILKDSFKKEEPLYIYYQKHQFVQPKIRQFINLFNNEK